MPSLSGLVRCVVIKGMALWGAVKDQRLSAIITTPVLRSPLRNGRISGLSPQQLDDELRTPLAK
eukprot:3804492-Amphidinium_carterae.1